MIASIPPPPDWDQIEARLRAEPGATDAMGEALAGLRREGEADRALRRIEALAEERPHERHLFLLSEIFHRLRRFTSADEALRLVRRRGLDASGLNEFSKRYRPRVAERRRFYRCDRECGVEGRRVAEVGGQLPPDFVRAARPRSWTSVSLAVSAGIAEPGFRGVLGDASRLPLRDEGYDLVFSSSAFEHIGDLRGALAEIRRILIPGGALFSHFSPVWSSAEGHHLRGRHRENLRNAGLWPLAPWEHLTTTPERMKERLAAKIPREEARRVVHQIYGRGSLNRLFYEDYVQLFHASGLAVDRIELLRGQEPDGDTLARLGRKHPGRGRWDVNGMWIVLRKEG